MKIIDLLNKIAIGEEVPHFKVGALEYYLNWRGNLLEREEDKPSADVQWFIDKEWLNTEVEIIEEDKKEDKKIETINNFTSNVGTVDENNIEEYIHKLFEQELILYFKINEIINHINKGD